MPAKIPNAQVPIGVFTEPSDSPGLQELRDEVMLGRAFVRFLATQIDGLRTSRSHRDYINEVWSSPGLRAEIDFALRRYATPLPADYPEAELVRVEDICRIFGLNGIDIATCLKARYFRNLYSKNEFLGFLRSNAIDNISRFVESYGKSLYGIEWGYAHFDISLEGFTRDSTKRKAPLKEVLEQAAHLTLPDQAYLLNYLAEALNLDLDPVEAEIAAEVTDRWDDRKKTHAGEDWIKNPSLFVRHVYARWWKDRRLRLVHLKRDPSLYRRYLSHIAERPFDDLHLSKAPAGRPPLSP